jgi:pyruvate ferredoxin oxidoreductase gamma subunit
MVSIRFHGRGGQGVVTAAELLALAAFHEGRYAQAFPSFGSERTGAPVTAFCRVDDAPIRLREPILDPDVVAIQDPTLLHAVDVFQGLDRAGFVLVNTSRTLGELGLAEWAAARQPGRTVTVAATDIARRHLGRPLPNVALLGALARLVGVVGFAAIEKAVRARFAPALAEANLAAAAEGFAAVAANAVEANAVAAREPTTEAPC